MMFTFYIYLLFFFCLSVWYFDATQICHFWQLSFYVLQYVYILYTFIVTFFVDFDCLRCDSKEALTLLVNSTFAFQFLLYVSCSFLFALRSFCFYLIHVGTKLNNLNFCSTKNLLCILDLKKKGLLILLS